MRRIPDCPWLQHKEEATLLHPPIHPKATTLYLDIYHSSPPTSHLHVTSPPHGLRIGAGPLVGARAGQLACHQLQVRGQGWVNHDMHTCIYIYICTCTWLWMSCGPCG